MRKKTVKQPEPVVIPDKPEYTHYIRLVDSVLLQYSHKGDKEGEFVFRRAFAPSGTRRITVLFEELETKYRGVTITGITPDVLEDMKIYYRSKGAKNEKNN